jgi:hypothetical protein
MKKKAVIIGAVIGVAALALVGTALWKNLSRKYLIGWSLPFHTTRSNRPEGTRVAANVCIVGRSHEASEPSACAEISLFPHVYETIGVDKNRIITWQNENGFDSGGVDRTGALLAPGYPIFSRLAWTLIDPVYLQGDELSALLEESKRASAESSDPAVRANLEKLASLAEKAQQESAVLRFFG